jgi:LPS O-antigen subunit length determinant protein (WzzB/FepE family)
MAKPYMTTSYADYVAHLTGNEHAKVFIKGLSYYPFAGTELFDLVVSYLNRSAEEAKSYLRGYLQRVQQDLLQMQHDRARLLSVIEKKCAHE